MYDSTSHITPGYRFQYHVPPMPPALSISRTSSTPASRQLGAGDHAADAGADDGDLDFLADRVALDERGERVGEVRLERVVALEREVVDDAAYSGHALLALGRVLRLDGLGVEVGVLEVVVSESRRRT